MEKTVILFLITLFIAVNSSAQHKITGRIINEETNTPLEFANVVLNTADSVYVTGLTSNLEGYFELKKCTARKLSPHYFISGIYF